MYFINSVLHSRIEYLLYMYKCPAFAFASRYFFDATAGVMKTVISVQRYE